MTPSTSIGLAGRSTRSMGTGRELAMESSCLPAANSGNDGNLRGGGHGSGESSGVADGFVAHKDVDVLAELAFFIEDAVAQAGICTPQECEGIAKRRGRAGELDFAAPLGKAAQWTRDVHGDAHLCLPGRLRVLASERLLRFSAAAVFVTGLPAT